MLTSSAPPVAVKISELLAELAHEVPAVVALRAEPGHYGADYPSGLHDVVPDADLLFVRSGQGLGALLRASEPDVALCVTFRRSSPTTLLTRRATNRQRAPGAAAATGGRTRSAGPCATARRRSAARCTA